MTQPTRHAEYLCGVDRRTTTRKRRDRGHLVWGPLMWPGTTDTELNGVFPCRNIRPYVTDSPPFTADDAGEPFPAGTLWVVMHQETVGGPSLGRGIGVTTNPLTSTSGAQRLKSGWTYGFQYRARGIPATGIGTITLKKVTSGTTLATLTVNGADGASQVLLFPEFAGFSDEGIQATSSWTPAGAVPNIEIIRFTPFTSAEFWAVPTTPSVDYTLRLATDTMRGGFFSDRVQSDVRRGRAGPVTTYESKSIARTPTSLNSYSGGTGAAYGVCDYLYEGAGVTRGNIWVGGQLQSYAWLPVAVNQAVLSASTSIIHWPNDGRPAYLTLFPLGYQESSLSVPGARAVKITIPAIAGSTGGTSFNFEVFWNGVSVWTATYTDAQLQLGQSVSIGAQAGVVGSLYALKIRIYWPGGSFYTGVDVLVTMTMSHICTIPLPFTAAGRPNLVAPGAYYAAGLGVPAASGITRLASGVVSVTSGTAAIAFKPTASGWYQVKFAGTPVTGIGDYEFGHQFLRSIARGYAGRPFYSLASGASLAVLTAYTPVPVAIASGGTTLTFLNLQGGWYYFPTITTPGPGTYRVSVTFLNGFQFTRGLTLEWSTADSNVISPEGMIEFETYTEQVNVKGTAVNPPTPASRFTAESWIVLPFATGLWFGHDNAIATWVPEDQVWNFHTPTRGSVTVDTVTPNLYHWFDGGTWRTNADVVLTVDITVANAQTIYLLLGNWFYETVSGNLPTIRLSWAAV